MNSVPKAVGLSLRLAGILFLAAVLAGCGTMGTMPPVDPAVSGKATPTEVVGSTDLLRPNDAVIINFSGVLEPPPRVEDRINEDGFITLPLVGQVKAASLTRTVLQQAIHKLYVPKYYLRLNVSVNPDVRYFYVGGQVNRPLNYPYVGGMTVLKAIAAAGDFTDFAKKSRVQVTRAAGGKPIIVNCEKAQRNRELDLPVYPDDRIFVPRRYF
ncbi:MAG: SLBB domain-containing protein [Verrucomicrobia bacterium]|nr:SLBB domain-containing protein [Verrucomicrobiota bacterium]